jgi:hypothetical protein
MCLEKWKRQQQLDMDLREIGAKNVSHSDYQTLVSMAARTREDGREIRLRELRDFLHAKGYVFE